MKHRGRKSAAELAVITPVVELVERPKSPHELNDEETEVWAQVIEAFPSDWFSPANTPLLAQYCRHIVQAKRVAELIERALSDPDVETVYYDRLLKMQQRESNIIQILATKMRISQQGTTNHRGNHKAQRRKLWEKF